MRQRWIASKTQRILNASCLVTQYFLVVIYAWKNAEIAKKKESMGFARRNAVNHSYAVIFANKNASKTAHLAEYLHATQNASIPNVPSHVGRSAIYAWKTVPISAYTLNAPSSARNRAIESHANIPAKNCLTASILASVFVVKIAQKSAEFVNLVMKLLKPFSVTSQRKPQGSFRSIVATFSKLKQWTKTWT